MYDFIEDVEISELTKIEPDEMDTQGSTSLEPDESEYVLDEDDGVIYGFDFETSPNTDGQGVPDAGANIFEDEEILESIYFED